MQAGQGRGVAVLLNCSGDAASLLPLALPARQSATPTRGQIDLRTQVDIEETEPA